MSSKQKNRVILVTCLPPITNRTNAEFIDDLKKIHSQNKTPLHHIPRLKGKKIDFLKLYNAVVSRGGFRKINSLSAWPEILKETNIGEKCGNASHAIRYIYQRYLEPFEKAHRGIIGAEAVENDATLGPGASLIITDGVNTQSESDLARRRGMRGPGLGPEPVAMVYHEDWHDIPNHMREKWTLTTHLLEFTECDNIEKALMSGLPNEVDFCLNSLLLMSHQSGGIHLNRNPRLIDIILASVGIYSSECHSLFQLEDQWSNSAGRNFLRYWYEIVESENGREFLNPRVFSSKSEDCYMEALPTKYSLFNLREDMKYGDKEGHRIQLVATVIRNLVMDPNNKRLISQSELALRFLLLCSYASHSSLRQLGLESLSIIRYPILPPLVVAFKKLLKQCLLSENRMERIRGLQIITRLSTCDVSDAIKDLTFFENAEFFASQLSIKCFESIVSMLTLRDMHIVVVALDATYSLSTQGPEVCERLVQCWHCVPALLTLLTLEAQAMGADSLVGVRIMQGPINSSSSQSQDAMTASALMPPPPVPNVQGGNSSTVNMGVKLINQPSNNLTQARFSVNVAPKLSPVTKDIKIIKNNPLTASTKPCLQTLPTDQPGAIIISPQAFPLNSTTPHQQQSVQIINPNQAIQFDHSNRAKLQTNQRNDIKTPISTSNIQILPMSLSSQPNIVSRPFSEKSFHADSSAPTNRRDYTIWWLKKNYADSQQGSVPRVQIYADFQKSYNAQFNNNSGILSALEFHTCVKEVFPKVEQVKVQMESGVVIHYNNIKHATEPEPSVTLPCNLISTQMDRSHISSILTNELCKDSPAENIVGKLTAQYLSNKPPSIIPVIVPAAPGLTSSVRTDRPVVKHSEPTFVNVQSTLPISQTAKEQSSTSVCVSSEMTQTDLTVADNLSQNSIIENSRKRKSPSVNDNRSPISVHCATQTNSPADHQPPCEKRPRSESCASLSNNDEIALLHNSNSPFLLVSQDIPQSQSQNPSRILYSVGISTDNQDAKLEPSNTSEPVKTTNRDILMRKVLSQSNNGLSNEHSSDTKFDMKQQNLLGVSTDLPQQHINGIVKSLHQNGLPMDTFELSGGNMKMNCNVESSIHENGIGNAILSNGVPLNGESCVMKAECDEPTGVTNYSDHSTIMSSQSSNNQHFIINSSQSSPAMQFPVQIIQSFDPKQSLMKQNLSDGQKFQNVTLQSISSQNNSSPILQSNLTPAAQTVHNNSQLLRNVMLQGSTTDKNLSFIQNSDSQDTTVPNEVHMLSNNSVSCTDTDQSNVQLVRNSSSQNSSVLTGSHYLQNAIISSQNSTTVNLQTQNSQSNLIPSQNIPNVFIQRQSMQNNAQGTNYSTNSIQGGVPIQTVAGQNSQTNVIQVVNSSAQLQNPQTNVLQGHNSEQLVVQGGIFPITNSQSNQTAAFVSQGQTIQSNTLQNHNAITQGQTGNILIQGQYCPSGVLTSSNTQTNFISGQNSQQLILPGQNSNKSVGHSPNLQSTGAQHQQAQTVHIAATPGQTIVPGQTKDNIVIQGQNTHNLVFQGQGSQNIVFQTASQSYPNAVIQVQNSSSQFSNLQTTATQSSTALIQGQNTQNNAVHSQKQCIPNANIQGQTVQSNPTATVHSQNLQNSSQAQKPFSSNQYVINQQPISTNQNARMIQSNVQMLPNNNSPHPTVSIIQPNSKLQPQSNVSNQASTQAQQVLFNQNNQIQIVRKSLDSTGVQHFIQQAIPMQSLTSQSGQSQGQSQAIVLPQSSIVQVQPANAQSQQAVLETLSNQISPSGGANPADQQQKKLQQLQLQLEQHKLMKSSCQGGPALHPQSTITSALPQSVSSSGISRSQSPQIITSSLNTSSNQVSVNWVGKSAIQNQNLVTMSTSLGGQMVQVQMSQQQLQQHLQNQLQQQMVNQLNQSNNQIDSKQIQSASTSQSNATIPQSSISRQRFLVQSSQPIVMSQNNPVSTVAQILCLNPQYSTNNSSTTTVTTTHSASLTQPKLQPRSSSTMNTTSSTAGVNSYEMKSIKPSKKKSKPKAKVPITNVSESSSSSSVVTPVNCGTVNSEEKYLCEWDGCNKGFDDAEKVYSHVYNSHFLPVRTKQMEVCLWSGCDGHLKRAPLSLLSHLHDRHCSASSLHNAYVKRVKELQDQLARSQSSQIVAAQSTTPGLSSGYLSQTAVLDQQNGNQTTTGATMPHHIIQVQQPSTGVAANSSMQHRIIMTSNPSVCQMINPQQYVSSVKSEAPLIVNSSRNNSIAVASAPVVTSRPSDSPSTSKSVMQNTAMTSPQSSSVATSQVASTVTSQNPAVTSTGSVSTQNASKTEQAAQLTVKEGPVTKHMRLTAALSLRNLAEHSMSVREYLLKHELTLAEIAFSGAEASRTVCQCLALIRTLPNLS